MLEKPSSHVRSAAHATESVADLPAQELQIVGWRVGQGCSVQVSPEQLQRIQFGSVGRQPLDLQPGPMALQRVGGQSAPVGRQAIPQEDHPSCDMLVPRVEKPYNMPAADSAGVEREEPTRVPTGGRRQHRADAREMRPVEGFPHEGRAPFGGPGRPNGRALSKAALIEEAQRGVQPLGFFLIRGQVVWTHRAMAASLRSRARRAGRWRLQPNCRKSRHVCGTE